MQEAPGAEISFNYWGQFKAQLDDVDIFQFNWLRLVSNKNNSRPYLIDVNCWVTDNKYHISFTYNRYHFRHELFRAFIESSVQYLREFVNLNRKDNQIYNAPTEAIQKQRGLESAYRLISMQKGMLFHSLQGLQA